MVMEGWSLNTGILEFKDVLKSLIKQDILIGWIAGRDLHNQVIVIWMGGSVRVLAQHG